jgi:hypothetical protein
MTGSADGAPEFRHVFARIDSADIDDFAIETMARDSASCINDD